MNPIIDHYTHQGVSSKNPNRSICLDNFYKRLPAAKIFIFWVVLEGEICPYCCNWQIGKCIIFGVDL